MWSVVSPSQTSETGSLTLGWVGQARTALTSLSLTFLCWDLRWMTPFIKVSQSTMWSQRRGRKWRSCLAVSAAMPKIIQKMRTLLTEDHYIVYTHSRKENHFNVNSSNEKVIYMRVYKYIREWITTYKQKSIKTQICDLCIVNYQLYMLTVHNANALTLLINVIKDFRWKLISVSREPPYKVFCITNCIWK